MIKVLDKQIADKIAAGEVIERPVSIVKELVENSIDAGADSITVEIKNGGKSYIRITDNGCGISSEEVETAFLRHATSKISTVKDLDAIDTLGFRGEALASIAAVTRTELITKTKSAKTGTRLIIQGGNVITKEATGCPDGTTILITDLFYNTPARLKFMKSDSAESSLIIQLISEMALAYKNVKLRLINNGKILFSTLGDGNRLNTILRVFTDTDPKNMVPVNYSDRGLSLEGYISTPAMSKTSRGSQIFFVNGRVIKSKVIEKGVNLGYKERLFEGRYPIVYLFLKVDSSTIDVNIHPNKREVRFDNELLISEFIADAIISALSTKSAVVDAGNLFNNKEIKPIPGLKVFEKVFEMGRTEDENKQISAGTSDIKATVGQVASGQSSSASDVPVAAPVKEVSKEANGLQDKKPQSFADTKSAYVEEKTEQLDIKSLLSTINNKPKVQPDAKQTIQPGVNQKIKSETKPAYNSDCNPVSDSKSRPGSPTAKAASDTAGQSADVNNSIETANSINAKSTSPQTAGNIEIYEPKLKPFNFDEITVKGVIFDTYIMCADDTNFYLFDQHAAHERIRYEELVSEYDNEDKNSQMLFLPIIINVSLSADEEKHNWIIPLERMGFAIEEFGTATYRVTEIPMFMDMDEAEHFIEIFIENIGNSTDLRNTVVIDKLIMMSCKGAVKANDRLDPSEVTALIRRLGTCRNPFSCPHGRPTFIKLSKYEIEKMFKRV